MTGLGGGKSHREAMDYGLYYDGLSGYIAAVLVTACISSRLMARVNVQG